MQTDYCIKLLLIAGILILPRDKYISFALVALAFFMHVSENDTPFIESFKQISTSPVDPFQESELEQNEYDTHDYLKKPVMESKLVIVNKDQDMVKKLNKYMSV